MVRFAAALTVVLLFACNQRGIFPTEANEYFISPDERVCREDSECMVVKNGCPWSCERTAINRAAAEDVKARVAEKCMIRIEPCDSVDEPHSPTLAPDVFAVCVDGRCEVAR